MDPRDHKGEEGVIEAAEDGMAGRHSRLDFDVSPDLNINSGAWCMQH